LRWIYTAAATRVQLPILLLQKFCGTYIPLRWPGFNSWSCYKNLRWIHIRRGGPGSTPRSCYQNSRWTHIRRGGTHSTPIPLQNCVGFISAAADSAVQLLILLLKNSSAGLISAAADLGSTPDPTFFKAPRGVLSSWYLLLLIYYIQTNTINIMSGFTSDINGDWKLTTSWQVGWISKYRPWRLTYT